MILDCNSTLAIVLVCLCSGDYQEREYELAKAQCECVVELMKDEMECKSLEYVEGADGVLIRDMYNELMEMSESHPLTADIIFNHVYESRRKRRAVINSLI